MILTQNIIKKIDLNNIYAIGNSLIIPIIVNIDKVLANNAKYIKTCILPKNIEYKTITNNVLFPVQVEKSNSENNAVKNSKIINHRSFGNNITLDYSKRILSKNSITTGQDLFEKQDLFISTQERISNNNNITIYSILDINQVRYSLGRDNSTLPGAYESSHQFVVSILNKDNVVLDFSLIDQVDDVKIDDYYQNVEEFDFEDVILQYLNTFSDSIDITINPYVFEGLQQRVVSGPVISYNSSILGLLENTLNAQNISRLTSPAKLKFEILGINFYIDLFNIEDNDGLFRTNNDLEVNNLSVALATKMIQENLVKSIREYFSISENPLNYTVSLTTIYSNTQISRDYIITRQEALQLYSDYERKNRQKIIEDEFRNKIDFASL